MTRASDPRRTSQKSIDEMNTYTVTIVDENGQSFSETVTGRDQAAAETAARAIFVRDLSNRLFKVCSIIKRETR